jgi:hypothetical protein
LNIPELESSLHITNHFKNWKVAILFILWPEYKYVCIKIRI